MNWDIEDKSILDLNMYFGVTGSKARCDVIDCARVHHTWHYRNPQNWVVRGKVKAKSRSSRAGLQFPVGRIHRVEILHNL